MVCSIVTVFNALLGLLDSTLFVCTPLCLYSVLKCSRWFTS